MRTIKNLLFVSLLFVFTTSCTDLTEDLITNNTNTIETTNLNETLKLSGDTGGLDDGGKTLSVGK